MISAASVEGWEALAFRPSPGALAGLGTYSPSLGWVWEVRPRGVPRHKGLKALSLCSQSKTAVEGHMPWGETLELGWADSTEAGREPPPPSPCGRCLFLGVLCRRPGRGWGAVGNRLRGRLEGTVAHPVPLPFHYPSLFQGLFSNEETGIRSWKVFCPRPRGFQ